MESSTPLKILIHEWVTGGGLADHVPPPSWVAEGQAMRRAVAADFAAAGGRSAHVIVTLDERLGDDPGPWQIVPMGRGGAPVSSQLLDLACQADYTVVIAPETSGVLAGLARALAAAGARSLGCSAGSIELTGNKLRMGRWLRARGISTPSCRAIVPALGLPEDHPYPAVLKPRDGAGSVDTFWIPNRDGLPPLARAMKVAMLQPFHDGVPMSASFLVTEDQQARLVGLGRMRVVIREGRFVYLGGMLPVRCSDAVPILRSAVESIPGLVGFVGVDYLWEPARREVTVLEINPRVTTSYVGLRRLLPAGFLARGWLAACGVRVGTFVSSPDLAEMIAQQAPVRFDETGNIMIDEHGVSVA
jgi:predicted ATP-grasp superfamily ATP-dependent carboligase